MKARWTRRAFGALLLALTPALTFAAQKEPAWVSKTEAGSVVQVVMQTGESFDAIWMGRDSDRAVFERLDPDETVSVPVDSVRHVRMLRGRSSANSAGLTGLGVATGFWGSALLLWLMAPFL